MSEDTDWTLRGLDYEPPRIDTSKAHSARVYDYLLGGKDNYPPDREAAGELIKAVPSAPAVCETGYPGHLARMPCPAIMVGAALPVLFSG